MWLLAPSRWLFKWNFLVYLESYRKSSAFTTVTKLAVLRYASKRWGSGTGASLRAIRSVTGLASHTVGSETLPTCFGLEFLRPSHSGNVGYSKRCTRFSGQIFKSQIFLQTLKPWKKILQQNCPSSFLFGSYWIQNHFSHKSLFWSSVVVINKF